MVNISLFLNFNIFFFGFKKVAKPQYIGYYISFRRTSRYWFSNSNELSTLHFIDINFDEDTLRFLSIEETRKKWNKNNILLIGINYKSCCAVSIVAVCDLKNTWVFVSSFCFKFFIIIFFSISFFFFHCWIVPDECRGCKKGDG